MICTTIKTEGVTKQFSELEAVMESMDFVRWTWDYEKAIYDKKYIVGERTYYLRLRGNVINDKPLENPSALLELQQPVFVEHFFPHGLDETADVPTALKEDIEQLLTKLEQKLHK